VAVPVTNADPATTAEFSFVGGKTDKKIKIKISKIN
jgi:hypothetical protein